MGYGYHGEVTVSISGLGLVRIIKSVQFPVSSASLSVKLRTCYRVLYCVNKLVYDCG